MASDGKTGGILNDYRQLYSLTIKSLEQDRRNLV